MYELSEPVDSSLNAVVRMLGSGMLVVLGTDSGSSSDELTLDVCGLKSRVGLRVFGRGGKFTSEFSEVEGCGVNGLTTGRAIADLRVRLVFTLAVTFGNFVAVLSASLE